MTIFIVGRIIKEVPGKHWPVWEILGAFTNIEEAVKRCKTSNDFVAPLEIDKDLPEKVEYWPGAFYPLAGKDGERKYAKVWRFYDAPDIYRNLSGHGGDEDWVVFIPNGVDIWPFEMDDSHINGWGHVDRHETNDGVVIIFAHA